jgi:N-acetylmuramic acid 6-phosphate etherase
MVDMRMSNQKLVDRGTRMVMEALGIERADAERLLRENGSVRQAIEAGQDRPS